MIEYKYDMRKEEEMEEEGIESEIIVSDNDKDSVLSIEDIAKLVQEQEIEIQVKMQEIKIMKTTIDALNKKIKLLEDKIVKKDEKGGFPKELNDDKILQEEIETLQYQHLVNLQRLEDYEETEETLWKKLHELGEMETCQEEKEAE